MTNIVGRAGEAAAIARVIGRLPEGPVGLLIEGEAGIGKTTLVQEAVRQARAMGCRVLQARPGEAEAELSHAALTDLVADVFDELREGLPAPQRHGLEVAMLLRAADVPADPRTTASALLSVITILARPDPLLIVVDDAQWSDPASRRALEFVTRRLPVRAGIVIAQRPAAGRWRPIDLVRALGPDRVETLSLGPLSDVALAELIRSRTGLRLPPPLLARVTQASGRNPYFALELADALARAEVLPAPGDALPVPRTLHALLVERIGRLSGPARTAASIASALSRPTREALERAAGAKLDVQAALLELADAGVLGADDDQLRFSHPLLASTVYGSLPVARRRDLHRRLADTVVDREERARHLARAQRSADEDAAASIEAAAALARDRGAPEAAAELYAAAWRVTPEDRPEDAARRMLGGAQALTLAGDLSAARARATHALGSARTPSTRARALLLLGDLATYTETIEARIAYQERALVEVGDDRVVRAEILLALVEQIATDTGRAAERAAEAVALLRDGGDRSALARALISTFIIGAVRGQGAQAALLDEALALEAALDADAAVAIRPSRRGTVSAYPLIWAHWMDDVDAARARFRLLARRCEDLGDVVAAAELGEFIAMAEFRAGNWREAEVVLDAACDTLSQFELRGPLIASFADRSVIDAHRGRFERARQTIAMVLAVDGLDRFWRMVCHSAHGAVEFCAGNYEAADRAWTEMRDAAHAIGWSDFLDDRSEPDHVEASIALGKLDQADALLDHLEWRGRTLPRAWIDAGLPRARALRRAADGDVAEGLSILDTTEAIPALPFETGRLLLARGQLQRRANRKLAAKASLTAALSAFGALGSPPWVQRAEAEIGRLGLRHRGTDELTDSERRIAELAASGRTNREVAKAAFVSPKTVEANLARVYQKLGIHSRAELGARMAETSRSGETQT